MGDWSCEFKPTGLEPFELSGVPDGVNAGQFLLDRAKKENVVLTEEIERLEKKIRDLDAENRRLRDNRQQWLNRDRDNQIVIQTLKDVISHLR